MLNAVNLVGSKGRAECKGRRGRVGIFKPFFFFSLTGKFRLLKETRKMNLTSQGKQRRQPVPWKVHTDLTTQTGGHIVLLLWEHLCLCPQILYTELIAPFHQLDGTQECVLEEMNMYRVRKGTGDHALLLPSGKSCWQRTCDSSDQKLWSNIYKFLYT